MDFLSTFTTTPLIAILRGLEPAKAIDTGRILIEAGFRFIEVPLNSPEVARSIQLLAENFSDQAFIGGGTVLDIHGVDTVHKAGGTFIVSPNCDSAVIRYTKELGLLSFPGIATPSEAFTALQAGADGLKVFPAELIPPAGIKAMRAVLPQGTLLLPVGGVDSSNMQNYLDAGAAGFGFGSGLFKPGYELEEISRRAVALIDSYRNMAHE